MDLPEEAVKKTTIGQSKVIGPAFQGVQLARNIVLDLLLRAASRLRTKNLYASRISLIVKTGSNEILKDSIKICATNDSINLSQMLLKSWDNMILVYQIKRVRKVAVSLNNLSFSSGQLSFADLNNIKRGDQLSKALDNLNNKFGKNTISLGLFKPEKKAENPIAFGHIPDSF